MPCSLLCSVACLQAAYLVAVLAEHHCTHQLITAQGSIAALLQIMHTACQAHTSSRTLDLVPGSTAQQARHSNSSPSTVLFSDRAAGAWSASAEASTSGVAHAVSDVMSARTLEGEGPAARSKMPESVLSEEVCRQEQPAPQDDNSPASSAANAESVSHSVQQTGPQHRVDSQGIGVCSESNSTGEPNQATASASSGDQEASSSFTAKGRGGFTVGQHDGDADDEASSSSIHSRLLRAARAAKAGSSGKAQTAAIASPAAAIEAAAVTVLHVNIGTCFMVLDT